MHACPALARFVSENGKNGFTECFCMPVLPLPVLSQKIEKMENWIYRGFLHACPDVFLALVHFVLWCGKWDVDSLSPELVVFGPKLYQV